MAEQIREGLRILRMKQLTSRTGLGRSTVYLKISQGEFPKPVQLGSPFCVGWLEHEVDAWIAKQVALRDRHVA